MTNRSPSLSEYFYNCEDNSCQFVCESAVNADSANVLLRPLTFSVVEQITEMDPDLSELKYRHLVRDACIKCLAD